MKEILTAWIIGLLIFTFSILIAIPFLGIDGDVGFSRKLALVVLFFLAPILGFFIMDSTK